MIGSQVVESRCDLVAGHVAADGPAAWPRVKLVLTVTIIIAVVLRVISALVQGDTVVELPGIQDQISYDALARRVLQGFGFSFGVDWWPATRAGAPTAHWSFLYTLYLSGMYGLFGDHPLAPRLLQAVIAGILYPWFAWRLGLRLLGQSVGLASAALIAVYGYFVYYAGALMTESFYILALLWAFDVAIRLRVDPTATQQRRLWLQLGVALGSAVLLRQLVLLFVPVLGLWLLWSGGRTRQRAVVSGLAIAAVVVGLMIAPWTIRNYQAFGRLVLLNTNAGYAFFWGNHPIHGTNFVSILPDTVYSDLIPQELKGLDEAALDSALLSRGLGFVTNDPGRYALLSLSRLKDYFEFWPSADSGTLSNIGRVLSFGLYLPFMLYGLWTAIVRRRSTTPHGQGASLVVLFAGVYSMIHMLSWALVRYRLPVDAAMMPFAALGVLQLASHRFELGHLRPAGAAGTVRE